MVVLPKALLNSSQEKRRNKRPHDWSKTQKGGSQTRKVGRRKKWLSLQLRSRSDLKPNQPDGELKSGFRI